MPKSIENVNPVSSSFYDSLPFKPIDIVLFLEIINGNPNGDPAMKGNPRVDPNGYGMISDVATKRKLRDAIARRYQGEPGYDLFVKRGNVHETLLTSAYNEIPEGDDKDAKGNALLCKKYYDVRAFGLVITNPRPGAVHGPVCVPIARSVYPIIKNLHEMSITRQSVTTEDQAETKNQDMGSKTIVTHAVYKVSMHISPVAAAATGFSKEDLKRTIEAFQSIYSNDHSATRGHQVVRKLVVFEHESMTRNAQPVDLIESVRVTSDLRENAHQWSDYKVALPTELPPGVKMTVLV